MPKPEDLRPEATALLADDSNPNGHEPESAEAQLLALLDGTIREKRDAVLALETERDRVNARLLEARAAAKNYEDMRKRALGRPLRSGRPPGRKPDGERVRAKPSKMSPEKLAAVEADIRRYTETHDEFRQVDIRSMPDAAITNSGATAHAFEALRQSGVIRFARADGNHKYFRLSRSAVKQ